MWTIRQSRLALFPLLAVFAAALGSSAQQAPSTPAPAAAPASSSVVLIIDNSAQAKSSLNALKRAAESTAKQFGSEHEVALMTAANAKPAVVQDFTADSALLSTAIDKLRPAGQLSLYDAIYYAVQHIRNNAVNERSAVIAFVSDLDSTTPPPLGWEQSMRTPPAVPIYLVALRARKWQTLEFAQRVAVLSGGAVYAPTKSSDLPQIANAIASRLGGAPDNPTHADSNRLQRLQRAKLFKEVWAGSSIDDPNSVN